MGGSCNAHRKDKKEKLQPWKRTIRIGTLKCKMSISVSEIEARESCRNVFYGALKIISESGSLD